MLISLHRQLHRLLHQRRGQLLLTLLAALWLALPLSATAVPHHPAPIDTVAAPADNHCTHHVQAETDTNGSAHGAQHGSGHHGNNHDCHCAQACHASPIAIVVNTLNLPPPVHAEQPFGLPQAFVTATPTPLYRPPITLAA